MSDAEPDLTEIELQPEPPVKRHRGRAVGLAVGALAVAGGGLFAALALADESNEPEDPVRELLSAIDEGDVLGALEQFEPGERDALRERMVRLVEELNGLEVLEGVSLEELEGVDFGFEELELSTETIADDVARVTIEEGRASYAFDPAELPLGDFVKDLLGDALDEAEPSEHEDDIDSDGDDFVATVKHGSTWYLSLGYTAAERAREDAGVSFDEMEAGVEAAGADSPEQAVRELITASSELDLERVLELLPPGEMGALQRYAGLFLDDAEDAVDEVDGAFEVELGELDLRVDEDGDEAKVFVSMDSFSASFPEGEIDYEGGCARITGPDMPPVEQCEGDDPYDVFDQFGAGGMGFDPEALSEVEPPELSFTDDPPAYGIVVIEVEGEWYVSPTRTALDPLIETLAVMERQDLDELRRYVEDLFATFTSAIGGFSSEIETGILEPGAEGF